MSMASFLELMAYLKKPGIHPPAALKQSFFLVLILLSALLSVLMRCNIFKPFETSDKMVYIAEPRIHADRSNIVVCV